jgi:hypothetical protein
MKLKRIFRIARKDFIEQILNWRVLFYFLYIFMWVGILLVVRWSGIFPFVIVLDAGEGSRLRTTVQSLETDFSAFFDVISLPPGTAVEQEMQAREADLGVIAPADFDFKIENGELAPIEFLLADGNWFAPLLRSLVEARVEGLALSPDPVLQVEETTVVVERGQQRRLSITPLVPLSTNFLGMIMTLIILVDQGSNALFVVPHVIQQERNQGTLGAMLVTPLTHFELLAGKFLGVWAYGLATSSFFLIPILFVAPNPILLGITVLLATAVLNLFGLLVGVIFTNEQMSRSFVSIFALPWTFSTYAGWLAIEGPWWVNDGTTGTAPVAAAGFAGGDGGHPQTPGECLGGRNGIGDQGSRIRSHPSRMVWSAMCMATSSGLRMTTLPRIITSWPKWTSPLTSRAKHSRSDGAPCGKRWSSSSIKR